MRPTGDWCKTSLTLGYNAPGKEFTTCNLFWSAGSAINFTVFDLRQGAIDFFAAVTTNMRPLLGTDVVTVGMRATFSDGATRHGGSHYQALVGTGPSVALPEGEALVVALNSLAPGSHSTAHLRLSGLAETLVDGNYLTSTGHTAAATWSADFVTAVTSGGIDFTPAVYHKATNSLFNIVSAIELDLIGSQRRRKPRF